MGGSRDTESETQGSCEWQDGTSTRQETQLSFVEGGRGGKGTVGKNRQGRRIASLENLIQQGMS